MTCQKNLAKRRNQRKREISLEDKKTNGGLLEESANGKVFSC